MEERLAHAQQQLARSRETDSYAVELLRHSLESVQREVHWLSNLIAVERNGGSMRDQLSKPTETN
jgi:hypothetical protein